MLYLDLGAYILLKNTYLNSFGFTQGMPLISEKEVKTQDHVAQFYEDKRYSTWYSRAYQKWWSRKMLRLLPSSAKPSRILDNGCGTGNLIDCLKPENQSKMVGSDISWGMLARGKKRSHSVVQADSQQLPFKSNSFDTVFARSLLHHLPNPDLGVQETARVLNQGGYAVFVDTVETWISTIPRKVTEDSEQDRKS